MRNEPQISNLREHRTSFPFSNSVADSRGNSLLVKKTVMGHKDSDKKKESHKRHREEKEEKSRSWVLWLTIVEVSKEQTKTEEVKKGKKVEEKPEEKTDAPDSNDEQIEMPQKRMRTRSMDMEEQESLYSMRRYRICPETIGVLNSHGITELFPIQVVPGLYAHLLGAYL